MKASILMDGPGKWAFNQQFKQGKTYTVGRSSKCELRVDDSLASSQHARFEQQDGLWCVVDLDSRNGTFVNGSRVEGATLMDADMIRIGRTEIVFNSREQAAADAWGEASQRITRMKRMIEGAMDSAGPDQPIVLPDVHYEHKGLVESGNFQKMESKRRGAEPEAELGAEKFQGIEFASEKKGREEKEKTSPTLNANDLLWVAEKAVEILGKMASQEGVREEVNTYTLECIREAINADNGFLMIPNRKTKKWVIESWVGNSDEWTKFANERPVPLTVANRAFKGGSVVTNAFQDDEAPSMSTEMLDVRCYAAVPVMNEEQPIGLLYFDTRGSMEIFEEKHIELLKKVGGYLLQVNRTLRKTD